MASTYVTLAGSIALVLAGTASADIRISPNGLGDAIYVPHFSVENDHASLVSVANHSDFPTSARIVLTESLNGRETLYFDVFLPPHSKWSGAVAADPEGARLYTGGGSAAQGVCTVPAIPAAGEPLRRFAYTEPNADGGPTTLARTRSGAVEVIELGRLTGELATLTTTRQCARLVQVFGAGQSQAANFGAPTSGLRAYVDRVNVADGRATSIPGVAIAGYSTTGIGANLPNLTSPRISTPFLAPGTTEHVVDLPQGRIAFAPNRGPDAISSLFMTQRIEGEIHTQRELAASTQWVLSFPTKHAYVSRGTGHLTTGDQPVQPFAQFFGASGSCETLNTRYFDFNGSEIAFSPPVPRIVCGQSGTLTFGEAELGINVLDLTGERRTIQARRIEDGATVTLRGLPVVGLQLSNFTNANARPGLLGNYSLERPLVAVPADVTTGN